MLHLSILATLDSEVTQLRILTEREKRQENIHKFCNKRFNYVVGDNHRAAVRGHSQRLGRVGIVHIAQAGKVGRQYDQSITAEYRNSIHVIGQEAVL